MERKKSQHYVDNQQFLAAIIAYREKVELSKIRGTKKPRIDEYIGDCFLKIATHLSYRPNFINYTYRDEMISDGIENCLQYVKNFNPEKSKNPFAYFTQIIYYAFLRRIQKEKKQTHVKNKMIEKGTFESWTVMDGDDTGYSVTGFDPNIMLPDEDVYKPKKKEIKKAKGLEKFMDDDIDKVAMRGEER